MSADLVPVDNMAALEALDSQAREIAITNMLTEARAWLAHAVEATEPHAIAEFKAQMATVAEATKQLNLSKEIQFDAQEMVRRAERGVGVAIRKGQAEGTVMSKGLSAQRAADVSHGVVRISDDAVLTLREILPNSTDISDTYAVTDGISDAQFDAAIAKAKSEGNLSRANVVRKVKGETAPKLERPEYLRGTRRAYDLGKSVEATVAALENVAFGLQIERHNENPDYTALPLDQRAEWLTRARGALRDINRFLKELT